MKQGTIKTLGAIALGAVAVIAGGGAAAAVGSAPVGPAPAPQGQAPRPGQPATNSKGLLENLPLNNVRTGGLPGGLLG
ncbi:hypothetical protein [Streptomyces sp. ME19-01-6]|uniref:hypothetical protein n=1 Tax=Streptomyces sp. ME19-01-6 TaxID=3028686 RepID=UPI0029BAF7BF|nr:hypothetical protein [Streptomyces sp. ME19-01-6]MDX3227558.1 hypothetical protein [Streptomyces sp. ME19-01-6]